MKSLVLTISLLFLAAGFSAGTLAERVIELADGSRIRGEIVDIQGDVWVIRSGSLGDVRIESSRIRSVGQPGSATADVPAAGSASSGSPQSEALGAIRSTISTDPGLMAQIMSLRDDPEVQAVLSDPEVMAAVRSLDFEALRNHPKFKALMNDPRIQSITSGVR